MVRVAGLLAAMSIAADRTIFFMITHGGSFPMALPALTNAFPGGDISKLANLTAHAEALIGSILSEA